MVSMTRRPGFAGDASEGILVPTKASGRVQWVPAAGDLDGRAAIAPLIESGALVRVLEDWCSPFAGYFLYYPSRRQQPAALSALMRRCACRGVSIEGERCRQFAGRLDLDLQVRDLLFGSGDGISAGDQTARRRVLIGDRNERACELRWVS